MFQRALPVVDPGGGDMSPSDPNSTPQIKKKIPRRRFYIRAPLEYAAFGHVGKDFAPLRCEARIQKVRLKM
jgi:hypothetical protein